MRNAVLVQAEGAQRTRSALILSGNGCGPRTLVWRGPRAPRLPGQLRNRPWGLLASPAQPSTYSWRSRDTGPKSWTILTLPAGRPSQESGVRLCPKGALHPQSDRTTPASPRRPTPTGCPECLLFPSRVTPTGVARALPLRRATQAAGPAGGAGLQGRGRCAPGRGASRSGQRGPARKGFTTLPKQRWKAPWDAHPHTAGGSLLRRLPTCHRILHGRLSGAETATPSPPPPSCGTGHRPGTGTQAPLAGGVASRGQVGISHRAGPRPGPTN